MEKDINNEIKKSKKALNRVVGTTLLSLLILFGSPAFSQKKMLQKENAPVSTEKVINFSKEKNRLFNWYNDPSVKEKLGNQSGSVLHKIKEGKEKVYSSLDEYQKELSKEKRRKWSSGVFNFRDSTIYLSQKDSLTYIHEKIHQCVSLSEKYIKLIQESTDKEVPKEIYSDIMALRYFYGIKPGQEVTKETIQKIVDTFSEKVMFSRGNNVLHNIYILLYITYGSVTKGDEGVIASVDVDTIIRLLNELP